MKEEEKQKHNYGAALFIILLLITIGFLVWLLLRPQSGAKRIPTGNVDVFNININCTCGPGKKDDDEDDDRDEECDDSIISYWGNINNKKKTTIEDDGEVYVDDNNGRYEYRRELHIFENAAFQYTNKIAPGVSNSYDFQVHNTASRAIRYIIAFDENTEYPINLRYRLKLDDSYVVGDDDTWVSASELSSAMTYLMGNRTDGYTLDWEWPYEDGVDATDTEAGEKMTSEYSLGIKINFEEA